MGPQWKNGQVWGPSRKNKYADGLEMPWQMSGSRIKLPGGVEVVKGSWVRPFSVLF
jgi:hypothetical protein